MLTILLYFSLIESDEDPFATDDDSSFEPDFNFSSDSDSGGDHEIINPSTSTSVKHVTPKKTRKKVRRPDTWKCNVVKQRRLRGEEYMTKGKVRRKKVCREFIHSCRYDCKTFTQEERQRIFEKFYNMSSTAVQNQFLASCIVKTHVKRKKEGGNKTYSTEIFLINRRVCREFLLRTLDISDSKFKTTCKKIDSDKFLETDRRGYTLATNKISECARSDVIQHIQSFPRYTSHYSRSENPNTRYLSADLNIRKMYSLYKELCEAKNATPVKESYYRTVFNTEFNLRFHHPHSDTCNNCDKLNNFITHATDKNEQLKYTTELELHQRRAQKAVDSKITDIKYSQEVENTITICFDLQKTLPTPLLTTNKAYYLRQLWTYNFCIVNLTTGISNMFVWDESVASRGSQEIGSCLFYVSLKIVGY